MKKNILIVEYDTPTIETLQEIFSHSTFNVKVAEDGLKAKDVLKDEKYDLVITAAMLPKFHGFNLSQFIIENYPDTKVVVMSGIYKGLEYKQQATIQYGASLFLEKPLNREELINRTFELLNIDPKDLVREDDPASTKIPTVDTAKIPAVKEKKELSSQDIFGDIIEEVESTPTSPPSEKPKFRLETDPNIRQLEQDLLKGDKREDSQKVQKKTAQQIEDEISKKFEQTLSGLGLSSKPKAARPKPETKAETEPKPEAKPDPKAESRGISKTKPAAPEAPKPKIVEHGYDILGLIARGGMAEIYKAKKHGVKGFEKIIALKKILSGYGEDDKYIEMFVDEAKIAAELTHPNIVQIYDFDKQDNHYTIAMEYVQGKDLRLLLRKLNLKNQILPEELSLYLVMKILEALDYAHNAKNSKGKRLDIVHRDISPPNILISYTGEVKITDFGVSKASIKMHQTISGSLKGKLLYMSPEQAKGDKSIDSRADIFSVGIILYELVTGKKPFLDSSEMGVLNKLNNADFSPPREVYKGIDPEIEEIIMKALSNKKEDRYQNAAEMSKVLETYIEKNFNLPANANHMSHFICDLFKEEIAQEGIKLEKKVHPKSIERLFKKPEVEEIEKPEDKKPPEPPEKEPPPVTEAEVKEEKEVLFLDEEFQPAIEIDLEASKKPSPVKPPAYMDTSILSELNKEGKSKKKPFLLVAAVIIIIVGAYLILTKSFFSSEAPAKVTKNPSNLDYQMTDNLQTSDGKITPETGKIPDGTTEDKTKETTDGLKGEEQSSSETQDSKIQTDPNKSTDSQPDQNLKTTDVKKSVKETPKTTETKKPEPKKQEPKKMSGRTKDAQDKTKAATGDQTEKAEDDTIKEDNTQTQPEKVANTDQIGTDQIKPKETPPKIKEKKLVVTEGMLLDISQVDKKPTITERIPVEIKKKFLRKLKSPETIIISLLVDHHGKVAKTRMFKKSSVMDINIQVVSIVANWKFEPATKDGKKVSVWISQQFNLKNR